MATIDGRTLDHKTLTHIRIQAVRRVVEDGERPSAVMESFGLCRTTIYPWLREFKDKGWEALAESIAQGPEPKLTDQQKQRVKRWILGKDPRQYGFDFGLWTRRIVQQLMQEKDLNPDEFVWSHRKTNGVSKKPLKQNEALRDRVEEDLLRIKGDPGLVRSFFRAPSVAYADD